MTSPNTVAGGDAEAIKALVDLAQKAAGELDVYPVSPPPGFGLPSNIPLLFKKGAAPTVSSVREMLEVWRAKPERRKGVAETTTLASFIDLVNAHKEAASSIFAKTTWPEPSLTAVIDYHTRDQADNCAHRIRYAFPLTDEFKAWIANNGKPLPQLVFAQFIEDHIMDLAVADRLEDQDLEKLFRTKFALPTEMLDLSRGLEVNVEERVVNAFRLQSGQHPRPSALCRPRRRDLLDLRPAPLGILAARTRPRRRRDRRQTDRTPRLRRRPGEIIFFPLAGEGSRHSRLDQGSAC